MKIKGIFVIFNIVIIFSFLFVFLMPLFVLEGPSYINFVLQNSFIAVLFVAIILVMNLFFILNWKLYALLEREDWPAIHTLLSDRLYTKGKFTNLNVRLMVNTCLLLSDMEGIQKLEETLRTKKSDMLKTHALLFGVARILKNKPEESIDFFLKYAGVKGVKNPDWIDFNLGFSYQLAFKKQEAYDIFAPLARRTKDAVIKSMTLYFLEPLLTSSNGEMQKDIQEIITAGKAQITKRFSQVAFEKEIEQAKSEIQVVIYAKVLDDVTAWLYKKAYN